MSDVIFTAYGGPPRVPAHSAKPLVRLLRNQAPEDLSRNEASLLRKAEELAEELENVMKQREAVSGIRALFLDFVNGWSALYSALEAMSRIPAAASPKGARAGTALALAFPDGVAFTRLPAAHGWAFADRLLSRLAESGTDAKIAELIGADHLQAAKKVTAALGEAIGAGRTPIDLPDRMAVQNVLAKFQRAVGRYSRVMLAQVDEEDPASIERFRRAVAAPIDRYRSTRTTHQDEPTDAPTEPDAEPTDPDAPADPVAPVEPTDADPLVEPSEPRTE